MIGPSFTLPELPIWLYVMVSIGLIATPALLNKLLDRESHIVTLAREAVATSSGTLSDMRAELDRLTLKVEMTDRVAAKLDAKVEEQARDMRRMSREVWRMRRLLEQAAVFAAVLSARHPNDDDAQRMASLLRPFHDSEIGSDGD